MKQTKTTDRKQQRIDAYPVYAARLDHKPRSLLWFVMIMWLLALAAAACLVGCQERALTPSADNTVVSQCATAFDQCMRGPGIHAAMYNSQSMADICELYRREVCDGR